jgi:hypothetical protein
MIATLVYGPQTDRVRTLLAAIRGMTPAEIIAAWAAARGAAGDAVRHTAWGSARDAARGAAFNAARAAVGAAEWDAAGDAVWAAAGDAAGDAERDAEWDAVREAVWDAAWIAAAALVVLDLVGRHGLTREHVDTLATPILTALPGLGYLFEPVDTTETEPHS